MMPKPVRDSCIYKNHICNTFGVGYDVTCCTCGYIKWRAR